MHYNVIQKLFRSTLRVLRGTVRGRLLVVLNLAHRHQQTTDAAHVLAGRLQLATCPDAIRPKQEPERILHFSFGYSRGRQPGHSQQQLMLGDGADALRPSGAHHEPIESIPLRPGLANRNCANLLLEHVLNLSLIHI